MTVINHIPAPLFNNTLNISGLLKKIAYPRADPAQVSSLILKPSLKITPKISYTSCL